MLAARFCEDFAETMARRVLEADAVATLYAVATGPAGSLPRPLRAKVAFRSAYVLERLYFRAPERFMPHADLFCERDFAAASGMSARRHFGKIMADLLLRFRPSDGALGRDCRGGGRMGGRSLVARGGEGLGTRRAGPLPRPGRLGGGDVGRPAGDPRPGGYTRHRLSRRTLSEGRTAGYILCLKRKRFNKQKDPRLR